MFTLSLTANLTNDADTGLPLGLVAVVCSLDPGTSSSNSFISSTPKINFRWINKLDSTSPVLYDFDSSDADLKTIDDGHTVYFDKLAYRGQVFTARGRLVVLGRF